MARNRIVLKTEETNSTFQVYGYLLSEKMKRDLRRAGLKTETNKWSDVFPNADVVYRFNTKKGKQDVYIGIVQKVKYPSGPKADLVFNESAWLDLNKIMSFSDHTPLSRLTYTVHANSVSRTELE